MKRTCAWCAEVISEGKEPVSHGICSICARDNFDVRVSFDSLLPHPGSDPARIELRQQLISILDSQGEILPAPDSPLQRLWSLANSEHATIDQCVDLIELDPALTTRVFRFANSAASGGRAHTTAQAVLHLGFGRLREVIFNAGIFEQLSRLSLPPGWERFWTRNLFVARLTERLAAAYFTPDGSEYLAGLLHDTGWLFLYNFFPEQFDLIQNGSRPFLETEKKVLPFTHGQISAAISARSFLPLRVVNAVTHHSSPLPAELEPGSSPLKSPRFLAVLIHLADRLADDIGLSLFNQHQLSPTELRPEARWLKQFGPLPDLSALAAKELPQTIELASIFFAQPLHAA